MKVRRRSFVARFGAVLGAGVPLTAQAQSGGSGGWQPARHEVDDWMDKPSAKHRFVFDTITPAGFGAGAGLAVEAVATALLVLVVLGATARTAVKGIAPFAIGLSLAALVVFAIPFTNAGLNPARATATALFADTWALTQLWAFWVAPLIGAAIVGLLYRALAPAEEEIEIIETIEVIES